MKKKNVVKNEEFEARMRAMECFHSLRLLPGAWPIVRVDGRSFFRFTEARFEKPFDARFREMMVTTATALLEEMDGLYAYTESDEISVLFPPEWDFFDRELEKIDRRQKRVTVSAWNQLQRSASLAAARNGRLLGNLREGGL